MCRPTQRSAARGHNSEGSFQFIKLCWVQRLLSREFTSACVHCFVSEMTVYRNTAGFLIAWLQLTHWLCSWACRQLKTRFFFFFFTAKWHNKSRFEVYAWDKEVWVCCTAHWTVECHSKGVRLQYQLNHNAMMTRELVWKSYWAALNLSSCNSASAFLIQTDTHTHINTNS